MDIRSNTFNKLKAQLRGLAGKAIADFDMIAPGDRIASLLPFSFDYGLNQLLTTIGRKSGQPRTTPLICGVDGERLILFATNFGGDKHPAWSYNLRANPVATVTYQGQPAPYHSREATAAERARYWPLADAIYAGYAAYRKRAAHREIPVFVLERIGD